MALLRLGTREGTLRLAHADGVAGPACPALREALAAGELNMAGPSGKDLPARAKPRVPAAAVPQCAHPRGARDTEQLPGMLLDDAGMRAAPRVLAGAVEDPDEDGRVALRLFVRGISAAAGNSPRRGCATVFSSALKELTDAEKLGRRAGAELLDLGIGARDVDPALPGPVVA